VLASSGGVTGTIRNVPVGVRRTLQRGARRAPIIGGSCWRRKLNANIRFSIIHSFFKVIN
jgi:hypothetical protein